MRTLFAATSLPSLNATAFNSPGANGTDYRLHLRLDLVSLTFLFVTLGATLLFKEPVSLQKMAGIGVILLGIILVSTAR